MVDGVGGVGTDRHDGQRVTSARLVVETSLQQTTLLHRCDVSSKILFSRFDSQSVAVAHSDAVLLSEVPTTKTLQLNCLLHSIQLSL